MEGFSGEKLREARVGLGLSQKQFAAATNLSLRTIQRLESGGQQPQMGVLLRICRFTKKPSTWFIQEGSTA